MKTATERGREFVSHAVTVSNTPWSQFKDSDYSDEQYARACLLDRGPEAGTAKQRYSIPVREPSGVLNRNACHAAAAVLSSTGGAGSARGQKVKATPEQIAAARRKLASLYRNSLDEEVPSGLLHSEAFVQGLMHYGVKGMRWGVRRERSVETEVRTDQGVIRRKTKVKTTGGEAHPAHDDAVKAAIQQQKLKKSGTAALSNQELRDLITRRQLEDQVALVTTKKGRRFAQRQLEIQGQQQVQKGLTEVAKKGAKRAARLAVVA